MSKIIPSEKVIRKLRYKNPDGTFTEYSIGANSDNIIVGEKDLTATIEQLNTKINNLDKQDSIFLISLNERTIISPRGSIRIDFSKDIFSSINFDNITSAYLEDSHPMSFMTIKQVDKYIDLHIRITNLLTNEITYPEGTKFLLYLTCSEDL